VLLYCNEVGYELDLVKLARGFPQSHAGLESRKTSLIRMRSCSAGRPRARTIHHVVVAVARRAAFVG